MSEPLRADPKRERNRGQTGIFVRAVRPPSRWDAVDIAELDRVIRPCWRFANVCSATRSATKAGRQVILDEIAFDLNALLDGHRESDAEKRERALLAETVDLLTRLDRAESSLALLIDEHSETPERWEPTGFVSKWGPAITLAVAKDRSVWGWSVQSETGYSALAGGRAPTATKAKAAAIAWCKDNLAAGTTEDE